MNRRELLVTLASTAAFPAEAQITTDSAIVTYHDQGVENALATQITDPSSAGYGGLPSATGLYTPSGGARIIESGMAAYLHPQSRFHGNNLLAQRIQLAAKFLERIQHPDGRIDLLETNFDSTPDTGFVMHSVCTAACLTQRNHQDELLNTLAPFIRKAAGALAVGGIHTPNHRWVVSSALAQANEIFPDASYVRRIDQWLAEGIDIDADGQYTERSTSVYNTVCDRALTVMAVKLKRPELLDPVRKNLHSMMYLLQPNYEVVTEISRRQDRDQRATMGRYWFPLRYFAVKDQEGQFLDIANHFTPANASLATLMEYPEIAGNLPSPVAPPSDYKKEFQELGVVRYRRGPISATVVNQSPTLFALRNGDAVIESVRFATSFFGKGQLTSLDQHLEAPYYQPLDPPQRVTPANWAALRTQRKTSQVQRLHQRCSVTETKNGFQLRIQSDGTDGVPAAIEIHLRDGGELKGCDQPSPGIAFLSKGTATYTANGKSIRIGPALHRHSYVELRGALPKQPGTSIYLTGFTPFDHTVEFECI
jgi:hypothetical protein